MELLCLYWQCQIWPWQELWFASKFCRCTSSLLPSSKNNLTWAYDWTPSTWSAVISINKLILNELLTCARDMIAWYWKADFLFGQQSINQLKTKKKCAIRLSVRMAQKNVYLPFAIRLWSIGCCSNGLGHLFRNKSSRFDGCCYPFEKKPSSFQTAKAHPFAKGSHPLRRLRLSVWKKNALVQTVACVADRQNRRCRGFCDTSGCSAGYSNRWCYLF